MGDITLYCIFSCSLKAWLGCSALGFRGLSKMIPKEEMKSILEPFTFSCRCLFDKSFASCLAA